MLTDIQSDVIVVPQFVGLAVLDPFADRIFAYGEGPCNDRIQLVEFQILFTTIAIQIPGFDEFGKQGSQRLCLREVAIKRLALFSHERGANVTHIQLYV